MELRERRPEDTALPVRLFEIGYLVSQVRRRLLPISTDAQNAWATLGRYRQSVNEHTYENVMWRLIAKFRALAQGVRSDEQRMEADWRSCADFLELDVLPNLHPLRGLLLSRWAMKGIANDDRIAWHDIVNGAGPKRLDELTIRIHAVLGQLQGAEGTAVSVAALVDELQWWNRIFLTARARPGITEQGAFLTEVIKKCPVDVVEVLHGEFDEKVIDIDDKAASGHVFCSDDLVQDVLSHLRMNAEQDHRLPGATPSFAVEVRLAADDDLVHVLVRNTGSTTDTGGRTGGGRGLQTLRDELEAFGARLDPVPVDRPWTFGIELTARRWRMR
jgi:hypothetical protein